MFTDRTSLQKHHSSRRYFQEVDEIQNGPYFIQGLCIFDVLSPTDYPNPKVPLRTIVCLKKEKEWKNF